jgi:polar amino acid transport system substrate-binding protein
MRPLALVTLGLLLGGAAPAAANNDIAPGGTLRAAYLASNPAQAVQDRATGAIRGASADLARELGRRINVAVELKPLVNVAAVIEAVSGGQADIGFIAYEPSRAGTVEFSQAYMLVRQSFLVLDDSPIRSIADVDRAGQKIAGTRNDSITLFMKRKLKQATIVELENNPAEIKRLLTAQEIDAFGANRQRLPTDEGDARVAAAARQPVRRAADHHRAEGKARGAHRRQPLPRRRARLRVPQERDRGERHHRDRGGAGRLVAAGGAGVTPPRVIRE